MEKKNALGELISTTMDHLKVVSDANSIIGTPIQTDGITLIPISKLSVGVAGGGTEFSTKKQTTGDTNFGGGSGASAKLEPVAFLVVQNGGVKLLPVNQTPITSFERVIETVPEVVDKVTDYLDRQKEKKMQAVERSDFAE